VGDIIHCYALDAITVIQARDLLDDVFNFLLHPGKDKGFPNPRKLSPDKSFSSWNFFIFAPHKINLYLH
jgi:hypothetical protein